jgi:AraC family transcriptional regulator
MEHTTHVPERGGSGADSRRAFYDSLRVIPESVGPRVAIPGGGVIHSIRGPGEQTVSSDSLFAAVMLAPAPRNRASLASDRMQAYDAPTGALVVQPANVEARAQWSVTRENLIIALRPETLCDLAVQEFGGGNVAFQPPAFGTVDLQALHFARLLRAELTRKEAANELYVDAMLTLFGIHLIRNYAGMQKLLPNIEGGLSNRSARRVQEYLDVNFARRMSVAELAAISGHSPRHFIQAFTRTFGKPPHRHLLDLRLAFAERLLVEGRLTIADVAELSGFSSESHLTMVVQRYRRMTPLQVRRSR